MRFGESIKDRIELTKAAWARIGIAVVISLIFVAIIVNAQAVTKGQYTTEMGAMDQRVNLMGSTLIQHDGNITSLAMAFGTMEYEYEVAHEQWEGVSNTVGLQGDDIDALQLRMSGAEATIAVLGSPPEAYLTGTAGNYTLHATSPDGGTFTSNIHLVFSPPLGTGNATTYSEAAQRFYGAVNWTLANRAYVPVASYNGTAWTVPQAWFNIGTFAVAAASGNTTGNVTTIPVLCAGLPVMPSFAYAEIYPALGGP